MTTIPPIRFYGRRKGKPLTASRQAVLTEVTQHYGVTPATVATLFPHPKAWLEIGFGAGEHVAERAARDPDALFIGAEPFLNGVASLCRYVVEKDLKNVRVFGDDARQLLDALPEHCLSGCYILFPDPWPKKRHIDRRWMSAENRSRLARVLKPGAPLWFASDHPKLVDWVCAEMRTDARFTPAPGCDPTTGYIARPADAPETRYEQKLLAKHSPQYFCWQLNG